MKRGKMKVLFLLLLLTVLCTACGEPETPTQTQASTQPSTQATTTVTAAVEDAKNPWEHGGKAPDQYGWEEFLSLSEVQQEEFFLWFETPEDFEAWMERVQPVETIPPTQPPETEPVTWGEEDKKPSDYTWEEFLALSETQQEEFFLWFETPEDFEAWMESVQAALEGNTNS